jgi:hypothetical protein
MGSQVLDRSHAVSCSSPPAAPRGLDQLTDLATWIMRPEEQRQALADLAKVEAQLVAI